VKDLLDGIDKLLENRIRLAIMSLLMVNERLDFLALKETLDLTDGNLASHLAKLEKSAYLAVHKKFIGKKPHTTYSATAKGKKAFKEHLDGLERIISGNKTKK
jgi:DNA-binding HxlR family transcriptional regulator